MRKRNVAPVLVSACLLLSLAASVLARGRDMSREFGDRELFTQANLRILKTGGGEDVIAINGRVDPDVDFIPLGRPARFVRQGMRGSVFEIDGKPYIVSHGRNLAYVQPDTAMRVRRVIDETSPLPRLESLSEAEQQLVRDGKLEIRRQRNSTGAGS